MPVIQQEGLFRVPGSVKTMKDVRAQIETDGPLIIQNIENLSTPCVCSLMKQWIREVPEGIISERSYDMFLNAKGTGQSQSTDHYYRISRKSDTSI